MTKVDLEYEVARLKSLLGRYSLHVDAEEGTDFLYYGVGEFLTDKEVSEICSYQGEQDD